MTWPRGVPSMRVAVRCQGATHHVLWRRGAFVLEDHDVAADAIVVALGGERPPCLELLRSWRLGYVEVEPPRPSAGLVRALSSLAGWMSGGGPSPAVLPEPLRRLREASILHTWGRGLRDDRASAASQEAFLRRAITRKLADVAKVHLPSSTIELDLGVAHGRAEAEGDGRGLRVRVPPSWLTSVWVPGLESRGGGFVLAAELGGSLDVVRWVPDGDGGWEVVVSREPDGEGAGD
jgi:hypothetical protein